MGPIVSWYLVILIIFGLQHLSTSDHDDLAAIAGRSGFIPCVSPYGRHVELRINHPNTGWGPAPDAVYVPNEGFVIVKVSKPYDGRLHRCYDGPVIDIENFYQCWHLQVLDYKPLEQPVIVQGTELHAESEKDLRLECQLAVSRGERFTLRWIVPDSVSSDRWSFDKDPILETTGNDLETIWKTELTVKNFKRTDTGRYTCLAEDYDDNSQTSIEIRTSEPGRITGGQVVRVKLNEPASLSCVVEGYPLSNFIWVKIDDSKNGKGEVKGSSTLDENESRVAMSLGFASVTRGDNGTYECGASDYNGTITTRTSLIVTEVPDIEINGTLANGTDSVYLNWTIFDGNDPVTMYSVQQKKEGTDQWVNCSGEFGKGNSEFVARELEEGTVYRFRITAANSVGVSQPAYSNLTETLRTDTEFVTEVLVTRTSNTSIRASWTPPEGEVQDHFHYYKLLAKYGNDVRRAVRLPLNVTDYVFPNLISRADYEVEVSACNKYTLKCVPSSKGPGFVPTVSIKATTRNSVIIGWSSPPEELRQRVRRYKVIATHQDEIIGPVYLGNTSNSYGFENLSTDASQYILKVAACIGENQCGDWSTELKAVIVGNGAMTIITTEKECKKCLCF